MHLLPCARPRAPIALISLLALGSGCADLDVSQRRVDFGGVLVGTTSAARTVTWKNSHTGALTVNGIAIAPAAGFARVPALAGAHRIVPGHSHSSDFAFSPAAAQAYASTATPTLAAAPAGVQIDPVALAGRGVNWSATGTADLSLQDGDLVAVLSNNAPMDFGSVRVGATSAPPKRFKIRNRSRTRALTVTVAWAGGAAGFAHDRPQPIVLQPRKRKWVNLTFAPTAVGAAADTLIVTATGGTPGAPTLGWGGFTVKGVGVAAPGGGGGGDGGDGDGEGGGH